MSTIDTSSSEPMPRLTPVQWLICVVASIGFAFDIYELLMLPLILPPALKDLAGIQLGNPQFAYWRDLMFYVPAFCGGIFGLLGGYLTDRLGRRRILVFSILLYALSALAAGFATSLPMLLFLRCTTFIGVSVEFVAAVTWIAELFSHPKQREAILGYTQAFSSLGGLMVSGVFVLITKYSHYLPAIYGAHTEWRYTLISGVIPAIPLIVIRPFLPESPAWQEKKEAGTLKRPSLAQIFSPALRRTTIVSTLLIACGYGAALGAIQQLPQIVPGLAQLNGLPRPEIQKIVGTVQLTQEIGGLAGRFLLAFLAIRILSRRRLLRIFQVPGLFVLPLVFVFAATTDLTLLKWGVFFCGLFTVAQFSFWGNYLPRVYPTHLRGTGESFGANIGGRLIGTLAVVLTTQVAGLMPGQTPSLRLAYAAAAVAFLVYAGGVTLSFFLPEPKPGALPE